LSVELSTVNQGVEMGPRTTPNGFLRLGAPDGAAVPTCTPCRTTNRRAPNSQKAMAGPTRHHTMGNLEDKVPTLHGQCKDHTLGSHQENLDLAKCIPETFLGNQFLSDQTPEDIVQQSQERNAEGVWQKHKDLECARRYGASRRSPSSPALEPSYGRYLTCVGQEGSRVR
jgi:hypothetical protein